MWTNEKWQHKILHFDKLETKHYLSYISKCWADTQGASG